MKTLWLLPFLAAVIVVPAFGQSCTDTWPGGTQNISTLSGWSCSGGGTAPTSAGSYTENVTIGSLGNNDVLNFDVSITITGTLTINSNAHSTIKVPSGVTLKIIGNLTDANNNVTFDVSGSLIVTGTLTSNNNAVFSGSGSIQGGTLSLGSGASCSGGCPSMTFNNCSSGNSFCSSNVPVKLAVFTAQSTDNTVELKWTTASELNFDYFDLQKSSDGINFSSVAQVKGHGTTNDAHNYAYSDKDPIIGRSYYRLTSNDFDGFQETFKIVSVVHHGEKTFHVSPNPSDGVTIGLSFNFENDADAQVSIYDNLGVLMGTYKVSGSGTISMESTLKSGIYLAKYTSSSMSQTVRFLVR